MIYAFGTYTLDTGRYELRQAGELCALEPHAVDILAYLLQHRERVVTKQELLEHLWPNRFVGEGILAQRLMMIRKAIGDSGRSQHCIKTLHGRGYRFAAAVAVHAATAADASPAPMAGLSSPATHPDDALTSVPAPSLAAMAAPSGNPAFPSGPGTNAIPRSTPAALFSHPPHFVGRDAELAQLAQWWSSAQQGAQQVGFIVGEAGIGKTALVDAFVARMATTEAISVGRGQCMDHYGAGEPYLPVLEALGRLCRDADGDRFVSCLRHHAPSWLAHLPALLGPGDNEAPVRTAQDVTPARMLRELTDALEVLAATRPLVLVLEDLHWSDPATLAWLAYLAKRRDPTHVLIVGTYRPGEVLAHAHPLHPFLATLRVHAQCGEIVLDALSAPAVAAYLSQRCAAAMLPASLPRLIHQRTSGHPLFLVAIVDELMRRKRLDANAETASHDDFAALSEFVPTNLRQYIEQQLDRLSDADQSLLAAASAVGDSFAVAAVAAGVAQPPAAIEGRYAALARQALFVRPGGTEAWPDGTTTTCYRFKHALYHEVVYSRMSVEQRMHLHRQIGDRKETGYGTQARQIAAELALHFLRGGDAQRAVHYLHCAAENALRRSAYQEAITHLTQGLEVLASLPDTAERAQHELGFLTTLGLALVATKGQAHADVERTYARARTLCQRLDAPAQLFQVLWGLFSFHIVRAQLPAAWDVGQQLLALSERPLDTSLRMVAHFALGQTSLLQGALIPARMHLEQGTALYDPHQHHGLSARAGFPGDLGVFCHCFLAHTLWHLGYPDQALQRMHQALALSEELAHPFSRALAQAYAAMLHQFRREEHLAHQAAEAAIVLCEEQGFPYYLGWGTTMQGWALTAMRQTEEGMAQMHRGMAAMRATGAQLRGPYYLALLAQACGQAGQVDAGLTMLAEALSQARQHSEGWHEAELHRLQGELLLLASLHDPQASLVGAERCLQTPDAVEQCFHRALSVARHQQARSLELRAAINLARVWQGKGSTVAAYDLLAPIYHQFTEGFGTADLRDAEALLDQLG